MAIEAFDAFISYNHGADGRLAEALRNGLQRFAKPWNRRRAMRVFHDRSSLELTSSLGDALEAKLTGAGHLILLASNESAASRWCDQEAGFWIEHKGPDSLLLVLTDRDGAIVWDRDAGHFDAERSTSLPPSLIRAFPEEPLWLDMRWVEEQGDHASLDLRSGPFRDAVATLSAAIQGIPKDQLDGEDVLQHRRFTRVRRAAIALLAVLTVAAIALAITAALNAREARRQEAIGEARRAGASAGVDMRQALSDAAAIYADHTDPETERVMVELLNDTNRLEWSRDLDVEVVAAVPVGDLVVWGAADGRVGTIDLDGRVATLATGIDAVTGIRPDATGVLVDVTWTSGDTAIVDPAAGEVRRGELLDDANVRQIGPVDLSYFGNRAHPEDGTADVILELDDRSTHGVVLDADLATSLPFHRERVFFTGAAISGNSRRVVALEGALIEVWEIPELIGGAFDLGYGGPVRRIARIEGVDPLATGIEVDHDGSTAVTWNVGTGASTVQRWIISETDGVLIAPESSPGGAADVAIFARIVDDTVEWTDGLSSLSPPRRLDLATMEVVEVAGPEGDALNDELSNLPFVEERPPALSADGRLTAEFSNGFVTVTDANADPTRTIARFTSSSDGVLMFTDDARWLVMAMRGGGLQVWALDVTSRCGELDRRIGEGAAAPVCTAADG